MLSVAAAEVTGEFRDFWRGGAFAAGLFIAAAGSLYVYRRFGYVYSAIAAVLCVTYIPLELGHGLETQRGLAALSLAVMFAIARSKRLKTADDYQADEYSAIQAATWTVLYAVVNLQFREPLFIVSASDRGWFYWLTYALIWLLPIVGLRLALRDKDRALMDVSLGMLLATLVTNKPYLGFARQAWDPILFGILLAGSAVVIRRWLAAGAERSRFGFTPDRLVLKDRDLMTLIGTASAAMHSSPHQPASPAPKGPDFGGGRSGGAGASGSF
jgi:hypothetical protein